ncbi:DNA-binding GntR family transcriptional regulator [Rhizobium subbaraonis]|uniref:DNA-binding GntR family transcriptional regulator n=2 Tax=Rhizobium subbaraonis TaxID=908946 RepID=A0A285U6Y4_9HYPH|nr:GntR family transcriptional regulator [Rhizobium subbaraonis]SOC37700.1 DNA-binding GntR family transcriptional regulator [Rhizobium subbaraonis]
MGALILEPLARPDGMTTHEYAHRRLRQAIMVGSIRPGESLTIRGIAEAMESSPTPVREALRRLSSEGALKVLDNRRIMVPKMTAERFGELIALRAVLEKHAARRAVAHITERQIDRLVEIDKAQDEAIARKDNAAALLLNQEFHRTLYTANPDQIIMPMVESVWLQLGPFLGIAMEHVAQLYFVDRHQEAIAALRKRDADAVAEAINADICEGIGGFERAAIENLLRLARQ